MAWRRTLESLMEMGFDRNRAAKAVANTGNRRIEEAVDWLMEHENDSDIDEPFVPPVGSVLWEGVDSPPSAELQVLTEGRETAFIETEDSGRRPMTEEEKRRQVKRLEEMMRAKQAERRERERVQEVEREKQRRMRGQELQQVRQRMQDEMRKIVDQCKREKMENQLARQKVKDRIARDKEERAQKFGRSGPPSSAASSRPNPPTSQGPPPTKKEYDESRIQVRLLDGSTINRVFKAQDPLAAVRVYVQMNGNTPEGQDFTLISPYPRHVYTELDMEKPLNELGLVPSALLIVIKK
ncbi:unnamed protein product [Ophioblennius macclurei]